MVLTPKIQALIDYANETTGAGDTRLGDAVKTLCDGYDDGSESTFMERTTANGVSFKDGSQAKVVSVKGNTWVRNQGMKRFDISWIAEANTTYYAILGSVDYVQFVSGHKYFISAYITLSLKDDNRAHIIVGSASIAGGAKVYLDTGADLVSGNLYASVVESSPAVSSNALCISTYNYKRQIDAGDSVEVSDMHLIDLTHWFGAGNEPTTALEFANRLGYSSVEDIPYMEYNPGEIIGVNHNCLPPARKVEYQPYEIQEKIVGFGVEEKGRNLWTNDNLWVDQDNAKANFTFDGANALVMTQRSYIERYNAFPVNSNIPMTISMDVETLSLTSTSAYFYLRAKKGVANQIQMRVKLQEVGYKQHIVFPITLTGEYDIVFASWAYSGSVRITNISLVPTFQAELPYQPYGLSSLLPIDTSAFPHGMHGINEVQDEHTPTMDVKRIGVIKDYVATAAKTRLYNYRTYRGAYFMGVLDGSLSRAPYVSTHFGASYTGGVVTPNTDAFLWCGVKNPVLYIFFSIDKATSLGLYDASTDNIDLDKFITWWNKENPTIAYALATPITTPCSDPMKFEAYEQGTETVVGSDAPITLKARYTKEAAFPEGLPSDDLPLASEVASLLVYANETTGANDDTIGEAVHTLTAKYK